MSNSFDRHARERLAKNVDFRSFMDALGDAQMKKLIELRDSADTSQDMFIIKGWMQCAQEMQQMFHVEHEQAQKKSHSGMF